MKLKVDIKSATKGLRLYGAKGEPVKVIRDCGEVLLVEGKRERFAVHKTEVEI